MPIQACGRRRDNAPARNADWRHRRDGQVSTRGQQGEIHADGAEQFHDLASGGPAAVMLPTLQQP
jgi:hypothetical protein